MGLGRDSQHRTARGTGKAGAAEASLRVSAAAHALVLERRGYEVNVKRVYRLYAEEVTGGAATQRASVWCGIERWSRA